MEKLPLRPWLYCFLQRFWIGQFAERRIIVENDATAEGASYVYICEPRRVTDCNVCRPRGSEEE